MSCPLSFPNSAPQPALPPSSPLQQAVAPLPPRPGIDDPNDACDDEPSWLIPINQLFAQGLITTENVQFSQAQYLNLVDHTGRMLKAGKKGAIPAELAPILERIGITSQQWQHAQQQPRAIYGTGTYLGKTISAAKEMIRRGLQRCRRTCLDPEPLAAPPPY